MRLGRVLAVPVAALLFVAALAAPAQADPASDFVSLTNQLRASKGVGSLRVDSRLVAMAQQWAAHMAATHTLSHNPNLAAEAPSGWQTLGENVGEGPSVTAIHQAFVNSPEHYRNLVDARFQSIGVGVVIDSSGTMWVTEDFMQGASAPPPPPPPPPPTTAPPAPRPPAPVPVSPPISSPPASPPISSPPAPSPPHTSTPAGRPPSTGATTTTTADLGSVVNSLRQLNANS